MRLWLHGNKESSITSEKAARGKEKSRGEEMVLVILDERKKNRKKTEGTRDREAEMVEKNYVSTLELELFLIVVVTAAGRRTGEHMWKQSSSKWLLIASSIGWAMFPNTQQHRLTYCVCWRRRAWVYFLLLFQSATTADSVPTVSKMMMSDKVIDRSGLKALGDASACMRLSSPHCGPCCLVNGVHLPRLCCPEFAFFSLMNSPHSLVFSPSSCVVFCTLEDPGCQNNTRLSNPISPCYRVDPDDSSYVASLLYEHTNSCNVKKCRWRLLFFVLQCRKTHLWMWPRC